MMRKVQSRVAGLGFVLTGCILSQAGLAHAATPLPSGGGNAKPVLTNDRGETVTSLHSLSESSIIIVGGRRMTVRAFRETVRTQALTQLGSRTVVTRSQGSATLSASSSYESLSASARSGDRLKESPGISPSTSVVSAQLRKADPTYCARHEPEVFTVTGKITPKRDLAIAGNCFGTQGIVTIKGTFRSDLVLRVRSWSDTSIVATIPDVGGVYDQPVTLWVQRTNPVDPGALGSYSAFAPYKDSLPFLAERVHLRLPDYYVKPVYCDQNPPVDTCSNGTAFRIELNGDYAGTDTWEVRVPASWALDSMDYGTGYGSAAYDGGFDKGPLNYARWTMSWKASLVKTVTTTHDYVIAQYSDTQRFYSSSYALDVYATGPAGTLPPG